MMTTRIFSNRVEFEDSVEIQVQEKADADQKEF